MASTLVLRSGISPPPFELFGEPIHVLYQPFTVVLSNGDVVEDQVVCPPMADGIKSSTDKGGLPART
tara:strand:+ start:2825 stop:3025 length:201 start_codon:yes stop_codon:yes gene_type:complete